jgi:hypothetical protein
MARDEHRAIWHLLWAGMWGFAVVDGELGLAEAMNEAIELVNVGIRLAQMGRREEAAGVWGQVVTRFGGATEPALREQVANALVNMGIALAQLGRPEDAVGVYEGLRTRPG